MKLHFEEHGSGEPLLLVHGLGANGNFWGAQVPALSRHFRVLVPDLRGSGWSRATEGIDTATMVQDLLALLDSAGIEGAHLVGHSFGSVLVQHLAVSHAKRVRSLALVGPILAPSDAARSALRDRAAKARAEGMLGIADATVQMGTSAETKTSRPEVAVLVRELVLRQDPESYARTCEAVAAVDAAAVEQLRCPTLIMTGDEDATAPPRAAHALATKVADAELRLLARCGHWAPIEQPRRVANLLLEFLFTTQDAQ